MEKESKRLFFVTGGHLGVSFVGVRAFGWVFVGM